MTMKMTMMLSTMLLGHLHQLELQLPPPNQGSQDTPQNSSFSGLLTSFPRKIRTPSKFATLGDLRSKSNDDDDDSEDEKRDLFTGGEKS